MQIKNYTAYVTPSRTTPPHHAQRDNTRTTNQHMHHRIKHAHNEPQHAYNAIQRACITCTMPTRSQRHAMAATPQHVTTPALLDNLVSQNRLTKPAPCNGTQRLHHARPIHAYAIQRITAHNESQHAYNAIQRLYCSPSSHQCRPMPFDCSCPSSLATL